MIRHRSCILILVLAGISSIINAHIQTSQSFMFPHQAYQNLAMQQALWHDIIYNKKGIARCAYQISGVYQQSVSDERTTQYFLPACTHGSLLVTGDNSPEKPIRNIRAEWLGITSSQFRGNLSINPIQRELGFIIEFNQDCGRLFDLSFLKDYWVSLALPIMMVENNLNFKQFDVNGTNNHQPTDIVSAFNQPAWRFSKWRPTSKSKIGLAEIAIRFGKAYLAQDNFEVVYYSGFSIPTTKKQSAKYLFNPFVGYNGHLGFRTGVNFQLTLNKNTAHYASCLFLNLESIFFLHNTQYRTFDLMDKQFSRFLQFNIINGPPNQNIPGVNVLTTKAHVHPYNLMDIAMGFRIKGQRAEFEIGYSLWAHGREKVEVACFDEIYGIAGNGPLDPTAATPVASSASLSTIKDQAPNDVVFVVVLKRDIDHESGSSKAALNHKAHMSLGYTNKGNRVDGFLGIGAFYEIPQKNTALQNWGFWLKCGAVF